MTTPTSIGKLQLHLYIRIRISLQFATYKLLLFIYSFIIGLSVVVLCRCSYRNPGIIDEPLGRLMSLNVALFANVLLASRLSTSTEVFAFLFFGIECVFFLIFFVPYAA